MVHKTPEGDEKFKNASEGMQVRDKFNMPDLLRGQRGRSWVEKPSQIYKLI